MREICCDPDRDRISAKFPLAKDLCATILATPTPLQQRAFDLLRVSPPAAL
jgi:hypothetical protein